LNIRAAMQNDVNGFPRAGAISLVDRGIHHFLMGLNPDSGGPPFRRPVAFWWKMPDGRRLFVWLGEHYGSAMRYLHSASDGDRMPTDEKSLRAAQARLIEHLHAIEAEGYSYDRLILTFTHPRHYDNGPPFPVLAPFIAAWNRLGLEPALRLTTATEAVFAMEKAVGGGIQEMQGEWTDWWANGDASGPRELAASRSAKRYLAAAMSPAFGPMPAAAQPSVETILKDLCLFDEHTFGANSSVSAPYSLFTQGQYVEKSDLAYRPMGLSDLLLRRREQAKLDALPEGLYAVNTAPAPISGWATIPGKPKSERHWLEKLPPHSVGPYHAAPRYAEAERPELKADASGWPIAASWPGMRRPLFEGSIGDFLSVGVVPPADRRTLKDLHTTPDPAKRAALRETPATYAAARIEETPHTLAVTQEIRHPRLTAARRSLELWKRELRARVSIRFDRISSLAPEVFFLSFSLPAGVPLPVFSNGGVPFTPYRDQLPGSCKDYFAIDGWAHYSNPDGHWLWVTRDAALVAVGGTHVLELHQQEPPEPQRILAMVFDNTWHTNFVADSNGTMEFQFELVWQQAMPNPADLAEALVTDPMVLQK
jgi:hypothetical protein